MSSVVNAPSCTTTGPSPADLTEALQDVRRTRDSLREVLPAVVIASHRFEGGDGVLTEPVLVVAEAVGGLDAAATVLAGCGKPPSCSAQPVHPRSHPPSVPP